MSFSLIPKYSFEKLTDISPELLRSIGVKLLLLDLDNTVSPYGEKEPTREILKWIGEMKAGGVTPFIVSNTKKPRAGVFAGKMGIGLIIHARKPSPRGVITALGVNDCRESETALVGDQIFTDTLAANRAGVTSILVEPISFNYPWLRWRYWAELPFRLLAKNKFRKKQ